MTANSSENAALRRWLSGTRRKVLGGLLAVLLAAAAGVGVWRSTSGLPEDAAFAYGDQVVTTRELDRRAQALEALYGIVAPEPRAEADRFRRDLAKSVAVSQILDDAARERDIRIADKQARDVLDRYIATQFGDGGRQAFVRALGNVGTSETAVLDEVKRQLAVGRLMAQVVGEAAVDDAALRRAFAERKATLGVPERRVVRNIVVASRQDAADALRRLRAGESFAAVASASSLDASTKGSGGLLGELAREQLEEPVAEQVFGTPSGGVFGPVQGRYGWNVGRVDAVRPPVEARFGDVREELRETLRAEDSLRRWRDWLGERIRSAEVTYAEAYRPADPDSAPVTGQGPGVPGVDGPPR